MLIKPYGKELVVIFSPDSPIDFSFDMTGYDHILIVLRVSEDAENNQNQGKIINLFSEAVKTQGIASKSELCIMLDENTEQEIIEDIERWLAVKPEALIKTWAYVCKDGQEPYWMTMQEAAQ